MSISFARRLATVALLVLALGLVGCGGSEGGTDPEPDPDPDPTAPNAPSGLSGTSGDAQVALEWNAVNSADAYTVYRAASAFSDVSDAMPVAEGLSAPDFTDTEVENGTLYYYRVTATAGDLESVASNQVDLTPFAEPGRP